MIYLLDVNALIALGFLEHEFHGRISSWVSRQIPKGDTILATTPITELGFVRVLSQIRDYNINVKDAVALLARLKKSKRPPFVFIPDNLDIERLPRWVKTGKQTTDGHLARLAKSNKAVLTTFDKNISGSFVLE